MGLAPGGGPLLRRLWWVLRLLVLDQLLLADLMLHRLGRQLLLLDRLWRLPLLLLLDRLWRLPLLQLLLH